MFTSRAEYRLQLREDNADLRLTEIGRNMGLIDDDRWKKFITKRESINKELKRLDSINVTPANLAYDEAMRLLGKTVSHEYTLSELLRRPDVNYQDLMHLSAAGNGVSDEKVAEQVEIQVKYHGYIQRQQEEISRQAQYQNMKLPQQIDYNVVQGLSNEALQKLNQQKPETIGEASRISGITPATISLLLVHIKRGFNAKKQSA